MSDLPLKRCSRGEDCVHPDGPWLPATDEFFFRRSDQYAHHFRPTCKLCTHMKKRQRYISRAKELQRETGLIATIRCALCGMECANQVSASHLRAAHSVTTEQYRALGYETLSPARLEQLRNSTVAKGQPRRLYGAEHPSYKGGCITAHGYHIIYVDGKRVPEHRRVAAQKLGRPLRSGEVVHHIDGNRQNNHPDNLMVVTAKEHAQLDANGKKFWHIYPETEEAAKLLLSLGWSRSKIARAIRVELKTVNRWLKS